MAQYEMGAVIMTLPRELSPVRSPCVSGEKDVDAGPDTVVPTRRNSANLTATIRPERHGKRRRILMMQLLRWPNKNMPLRYLAPEGKFERWERWDSAPHPSPPREILVHHFSSINAKPLNLLKYAALDHRFELRFVSKNDQPTPKPARGVPAPVQSRPGSCTGI